jgi:UDP-glucose 4-epimerase
MRIAVTGSSGQVGSRLCEQLRKSHDVHGLDRLPGPSTTTVVDITTPEALTALKGFDVIYHLAAAISVPESVENPLRYVHENIVGTVNVLEAARRTSARVVVISTAAVYGEPQTSPIPETHPTNPTSPYGLTKLTGEDFARMFRRLYALEVSIVRPFNIYSENLKPDNPYVGVLAIYLRNAREGKALVVHGDGGQTRDFVHVSDVVQLLEKLAPLKGKGEAYNCGTGVVTSILDLAELVRKRFGPEIPLVHGAARDGDIRHGIADISKARSLGYEPKVRLADWIQNTPLSALF